MLGDTSKKAPAACPLLSFVIPYYNVGAELLGRCLDSIATQDLSGGDCEVILVDDGSDDFPHNLLKRQPFDVRYLPVAHQGPGAARNAGLDAARGKYVQFVDADDYLYAGTLSLYVPLLKEGQYDIFCFDFKPTRDIHRADVPLPRVLRLNTYQSGAEFMCRRNLPGIVWLYAFRRKLVTSRHIRFTTVGYHEDEEFCTALFLRAGTTVHAPLPVYAYYHRPESIMTAQTRGHLEKRLSDFRKMLGRVAAWRQAETTLNAEQRMALERKVNFLSCDYIRNLFRAQVPLRRVVEEVRTMRAEKLFPLPRRDYSLPYEVFRLLSQARWGLYLLSLAERMTYKMRQ